MPGNVSKNAHREGSKTLMSKWGGAITIVLNLIFNQELLDELKKFIFSDTFSSAS